MKPRLRYRLVNALFSNFISNFFYMFNDSEFEASSEFTMNFVSNIYSQLYLPENMIIEKGDEFESLIMIQESIVSLLMTIENQQLEFFILPTYSYFGDY